MLVVIYFLIYIYIYIYIYTVCVCVGNNHYCVRMIKNILLINKERINKHMFQKRKSNNVEEFFCDNKMKRSCLTNSTKEYVQLRNSLSSQFGFQDHKIK